jgi:poly-gamma-glutamate synthesis protein (capsule biosynthesis protein)
LQGQSKKDFLARIETYRKNLVNEVEWLKEWEAFVKREAKKYIFIQYFPVIARGSALLARNIIAKILCNRSNRLGKLNMIRCQSHLELLTTILELRK